MSDTPAIRASRLPDVVNAGYSTRKERTASDVVMMWMRTVERTRPLLLSIVVDGLERWRKVSRPHWRPFGLTDDTIDEIFRVFVAWAGPNPAEQLLILHGQMAAQERAAWDHRARTQIAMREGLRAAMKDLRNEQKRSKSRVN